MLITVRDATEADLPDILAIYNEAIRTSTAVYTEQETTRQERQQWLAARQGQGFPVLVAADQSDGSVLGAGSLLVDKHVMVAGIDATNQASIRLHERLGFERAGTLREVGFKFGSWLDLVFMQRFLGAPEQVANLPTRRAPCC